MPYDNIGGIFWEPDFALLEAMPGGRKLSEWFGFATDFHDAPLVGIDLQGSTAKLTIEAFRMTSDTDSRGFYILDRHATVTLTLSGVRRAAITSELPTTLLELAMRRVAGSGEGELEVAFDDVMGAGGSIFATSAAIEFVPAILSPDRKST